MPIVENEMQIKKRNYTFNVNNSHLLQIKIHPENNGHYFFPPESQFTIFIYADSLHMYPPYPDSYDFHFKRIK